MSKYSDVLEKFGDLKRKYDDERNTDEKEKIRKEAKPYAEDFLKASFDPESLIDMLGFECILDHYDLADKDVLDLARKEWVKKNINGIFKQNFENLLYGITPTFVAENCDETHLHDLASDGMLVKFYVNKGGDPDVLFNRVVDIYGYEDYDVVSIIISYGLVSEFDEEKLRESFAEARLDDTTKGYYVSLLKTTGFWDYEDAENLVSGKLF